MPSLPFFSDTRDLTPDFNTAWEKYTRAFGGGGQTPLILSVAQKEYYKKVKENREKRYGFERNKNINTLYGKQYQSHTHSGSGIRTSDDDIIKKLVGDGISESQKLINSKTTRRYGYDHDIINTVKTRSLNDDIDQIRKGTGKFAPSKRKKLVQDPFSGEATRRNLRMESDDKSDDCGIGLGIIMAFIGVAVTLIIGIMIYSEVSNAIELESIRMNSTGWGVESGGDPLEMLLKPFDQITNTLGDLVGLDDFPIWALLPLIIGITMLILKMKQV